MTVRTADTSLIIDTKPPGEPWAVVEHHCTLAPGEPPQVIYVGASRLCDVFKLNEARVNSDWRSIFATGGHVLCRIIATADNRYEAIAHAKAHLATFPTMPRCNLHGYNTKGSARRIRCSNGATYDSQSACADALSVTQSAVSQHLAGKTATVAGWVCEYAD